MGIWHVVDRSSVVDVASHNSLNGDCKQEHGTGLLLRIHVLTIS